MIGLITNLDIYFSSVCNNNCSYCNLNNDFIQNELIANSLETKQFFSNIKPYLTTNITSIGIWGLEPTVNGKYFQKFIYDILNYTPSIKYIIISTNFVSDTVYHNFIEPIILYSNVKRRKIKLIIQCSFENSEILHNCNRSVPWTKVVSNITNTIKQIPNQIPYTKIQFIQKATLTKENLSRFSPVAYKRNSSEIFSNLKTKNKNSNIDLSLLGVSKVSIAVPDEFTQLDGQLFKKWDHNIKTDQFYQCAAGKTSLTLNYLGESYDCHLLCNQSFNLATSFDLFSAIANTLIEKNIIPKQDINILYNGVSSIFCWALSSIDSLPSYIKLVGNVIQ